MFRRNSGSFSAPIQCPHAYAGRVPAHGSARVPACLAADWRPDVFVDVRSGDRYMAIPYAHRAAGPTNRADRAAMLDGLRSVTSMFARTHPRMGNVPSGPAASMGEEPYRATGTALDYMYVKAGVRRCYMLEVYGASTVYGVGNRKDRGIGRVPSSASVVNLLQLSSRQLQLRRKYLSKHAKSRYLQSTPAVARILLAVVVAKYSDATGLS